MRTSPFVCDVNCVLPRPLWGPKIVMDVWLPLQNDAAKKQKKVDGKLHIKASVASKTGELFGCDCGVYFIKRFTLAFGRP